MRNISAFRQFVAAFAVDVVVDVDVDFVVVNVEVVVAINDNVCFPVVGGDIVYATVNDDAVVRFLVLVLL